MQKAIVTGGSGFIGSHVVDALKDAGYDVTVIDYRVQPHRQDVGFENVDLMDLSSVLSATRGAQHIFHLAAVSNVNYAYKYPVYTTALNVVGTANVLEAARINGGARVYLASTVWVYNGCPNDKVVDEASPFYLDGAGHIYTSTKMACEMICHNYAQLYKVPFTVLRLGIPYGPRMREELLIPIFIKKALNGQPLTIAGKGDQYRNFIYVRDLAEGHVAAMKDAAINQTYNLEGTRKVARPGHLLATTDPPAAEAVRREACTGIHPGTRFNAYAAFSSRPEVSPASHRGEFLAVGHRRVEKPA